MQGTLHLFQFHTLFRFSNQRYLLRPQAAPRPHTVGLMRGLSFSLWGGASRQSRREKSRRCCINRYCINIPQQELMHRSNGENHLYSDLDTISFQPTKSEIVEKRFGMFLLIGITSFIYGALFWLQFTIGFGSLIFLDPVIFFVAFIFFPAILTGLLLPIIRSGYLTIEKGVMKLPLPRRFGPSGCRRRTLRLDEIERIEDIMGERYRGVRLTLRDGDSSILWTAFIGERAVGFLTELSKSPHFEQRKKEELAPAKRDLKIGEWMENDISKVTRNFYKALNLAAPLLVMVPGILFLVPMTGSVIRANTLLWSAAILSLALGSSTYLLVIPNQRRIPAKVFVGSSEIRWIDRRGREKQVNFDKVTKISELFYLPESVIFFVDVKGKRAKISVGPKVAEIAGKAFTDCKEKASSAGMRMRRKD